MPQRFPELVGTTGMSATHTRWRWATALAAFGVAVATSEALLGIYVPGILVWRDIKDDTGYRYPSAYSDYLPFTLPHGVTMVHEAATPPTHVTYVFNGYGFRGPEIPPPPEGPARRVVVLGDSFTFGWRVGEDETFPARLQALLGDENRRCAVINAGYHSGYSPDAYYASLLRERSYFAPSVIIVALYLGNDVDDVADNRWPVVDGYGLPLRVTTPRRYVDPDGRYISGGGGVYRVPFLRESRLFIGLAQLLDGRDRKRTTDAWQAFAGVLAGLHRAAGELRADDLFVLIPPIQHVEADTRYTYRLDDPLTGRTAEYLRQTIGAPVLDLRETFASEPSVEALAMRYDGHFTPEADVKVAAAIHQALATSGVLDRRCPVTGAAEVAQLP